MIVLDFTRGLYVDITSSWVHGESILVGMQTSLAYAGCGGRSCIYCTMYIVHLWVRTYFSFTHNKLLYIIQMIQ